MGLPAAAVNVMITLTTPLINAAHGKRSCCLCISFFVSRAHNHPRLKTDDATKSLRYSFLTSRAHQRNLRCGNCSKYNKIVAKSSYTPPKIELIKSNWLQRILQQLYGFKKINKRTISPRSNDTKVNVSMVKILSKTCQ
ncbi:hypothetical protein GOODEAATRI_028508 [Goodea atripinnis]|uniref:Uncharacterized protein n=1 Tax=Goodea atripinnis TaxID=208336 RepID=A0ABV0MLJ6_9TELE